MADMGGQVDRRRWHLDKSVSVSHIIATLSLLGAVAYQYSTFNSHLAVLENQQQNVTAQLTTLRTQQQQVDSRQNSEIVELRRDIRDSYDTIQTKIDTLIARAHDGRR